MSNLGLGTKKRPLSNKNPNVNKTYNKRKLTIKTSLTQGKENITSNKKEKFDHILKNNSDEIEANQLNALQNSSPSKFNKLENNTKLTKENLKLLQKQIFRFENIESPCGHYMCSNKNICSLSCSRLWFLFELELTVDGNWNFRNKCYQEKVYKKIDISWEVENCLDTKFSRGIQKFYMSHITFVPLPDIKNSLHEINNSIAIDDVDVEIDTIIERDNIKDQFKKKKTKLIPSTILFSRNKNNTFEHVPVDIKKIINDESSSSFLSSIEDRKYEKSLTPLKKSESHAQYSSYFRK